MHSVGQARSGYPHRDLPSVLDTEGVCSVIRIGETAEEAHDRVVERSADATSINSETVEVSSASSGMRLAARLELE